MQSFDQSKISLKDTDDSSVNRTKQKRNVMFDSTTAANEVPSSKQKVVKSLSPKRVLYEETDNF